MRFTILEYLCCGGLGGTSDQSNSSDGANGVEPVLQDLLTEGFAMWRSVVDDLLEMGHHVTSVIGPGIATLITEQCPSWTEERLKLVAFDPTVGLEAHWIEVSRESDRVLVIAPEIDNTLARLVERLRSNKRVVIASSRHFLKVASDKWLTYRTLEDHIPQPKTCLASELDQAVEGDYRSACGIIMKPRDGAGGEGYTSFESWSEFEGALNRLEFPERWLVQPKLQGMHCSCAILVDDAGCIHVLGATEQLLERKEQGVHYSGARGLLRVERDAGLEHWCKQVLALIPGAFGWIGIDYILRNRTENNEEFLAADGSEDFERVLIEINPRLTSSYLLYRRVFGPQLSEGLFGLDPGLEASKTTAWDHEHVCYTDPTRQGQ